MVVLATGMVPATALGEAIKIVVEDEKDKKEDQPPAPTDIIIRSNILTLITVRGRNCRRLSMGSLTPIFVCFPYETRPHRHLHRRRGAFFPLTWFQPWKTRPAPL